MAGLLIPIPALLLRRIVETFLDMQHQGAVCHDRDLMQDLDKALANHDRKPRRPLQDADIDEDCR